MEGGGPFTPASPTEGGTAPSGDSPYTWANRREHPDREGFTMPHQPLIPGLYHWDGCQHPLLVLPNSPNSITRKMAGQPEVLTPCQAYHSSASVKWGEQVSLARPPIAPLLPSKSRQEASSLLGGAAENSNPQAPKVTSKCSLGKGRDVTYRTATLTLVVPSSPLAILPFLTAPLTFNSSSGSSKYA